MTQQEQYYWQQMQRQNTLRAYYAQFGQNGHFGLGLSSDDDNGVVNGPVSAPSPSFTITLVAQEGGQVVPDTQTVAGGTEVEIAAIPNEGYVFLKWSDGNENPSRSVVVNRNMELTAIFDAEKAEVVEEVEDVEQEKEDSKKK